MAHCDLHGASESRFLCQHLTLTSEGLGFVVGGAGDEAWCARCDEVWEAEGAWNDVVERQLDIKHVCEACFDEIRARNAANAVG